MHILTERLRKEPKVLQTREGGSMFIVELAEYIKSPNGHSFTNYVAKFFPKSQEHEQFLKDVLLVNNVITISAEKLSVDLFEGANGSRVTLQLENPRLVRSISLEPPKPKIDHQPQQPNQQPNQQGWPHLQNQNQSYNEPPIHLDDEIPF